MTESIKHLQKEVNSVLEQETEVNEALFQKISTHDAISLLALAASSTMILGLLNSNFGLMTKHNEFRIDVEGYKTFYEEAEKNTDVPNGVYKINELYLKKGPDVWSVYFTPEGPMIGIEAPIMKAPTYEGQYKFKFNGKLDPVMVDMIQKASKEKLIDSE